jgi:hypothetical protein
MLPPRPCPRQLISPTSLSNPAGSKKKSAAKAEKKAVVPPAPEEDSVPEPAAERRPGKQSFIVDDATNEDHSVIALSPAKMQELDIYQVAGFVRIEGVDGEVHAHGSWGYAGVWVWVGWRLEGWVDWWVVAGVKKGRSGAGMSVASRISRGISPWCLVQKVSCTKISEG